MNLKVECAYGISEKETQFYFYFSLLLFSFSTHLQPHFFLMFSFNYGGKN